MALTASDFQPPLGASVFGSDYDLETLLAGWIAEAEAKAAAAGVDPDGDAARAYVLWRAYDTRCQTPISTAGGAIKRVDADDEGSVEYDTGSVSAPDYCGLAARYLARLGALAPETAGAYADWPSVHSLR